MSADNPGGAAYLERTLGYGYDPRDRVASVAKTAPGGATLATESYTHDPNGNVVAQTTC